MKPFPIPVVALGPGSQKSDEDGELSYLELPREMNTFSMPQLPDPERARDMLEAREAVRWIAEATAAWRPGEPNPRFDAAVLDAENRQILNEVLGEGEVSVLIGSGELRAQESVFAGVWRVQELGPGGVVRRDFVEIGPVPEAAVAAARAGASTEIPRHDPPADAFSAPPVLEEVAHRARTRRPGDPAHVINLSLLPMSPSDGEFLGKVLAAGPVRILSRGYGNCRITSTVVRDTWWVQYVNGYGKPMVDSIEITDIPEVALASAEDIADSAGRLREALEWLEKG